MKSTWGIHAHLEHFCKLGHALVTIASVDLQWLGLHWWCACQVSSPCHARGRCSLQWKDLSQDHRELQRTDVSAHQSYGKGRSTRTINNKQSQPTGEEGRDQGRKITLGDVRGRNEMTGVGGRGLKGGGGIHQSRREGNWGYGKVRPLHLHNRNYFLTLNAISVTIDKHTTIVILVLREPASTKSFLRRLKVRRNLHATVN